VVAGEIIGREAEQTRLARMLGSRVGPGSALVLRGEAGVGKSTLLDWAARRAAPAQVLIVTGVQAEVDVAYAGLHRLTLQLPPGGAPESVRTTILSAVGADRPQLTPVRAGLAFLELVTAAAAERPVLITVDDGQWLDGPSWEALTFMARRLHTDPVLFLTALRDGPEAEARLERAGLAELRIPPLDEAAAAALLDRQAPGLRAEVRGRVLAEAAGNPLGLVELGEAAGRWGPAAVQADALPLPERLERSFARSVTGLPAATRSLLLVAAIDDEFFVDEIVAAAARLDDVVITADDFGPAVGAGLVVIDAPLLVRFRHPLVRSALRQSAPIARRRAAHAALATTLARQPERQIWHRAEAATEPDERLAAELAAMGNEGRRHGAPRMAMAALERAAQLSEDPREASSRRLWAAVAAHDVGDVETVVRLFQGLEKERLPPAEQARFTWIREIVLEAGWSGASRMPALVELLERMRKDGDSALAMETLVSVALRCFWSNPDRATRELIVAAAERLSGDLSNPQYVSVLALVAPLEQCAVVLERMRVFATELSAIPEHLELLAHAAAGVSDFRNASVFGIAAATAMRGQGRLGALAQNLHGLATYAGMLGDLRQSVTLATEARALALETGQPNWALTADLARGYAEALRGNGTIALELADRGERNLLPKGALPLLALVQLIRGAEALAGGRHVAAYEALHRIFDPAETPYHPVVRFWALSHLVEAGVACGRSEDLRELIDEVGSAGPFPVLWVAVNYSRPLLAADSEAEAAYEEALAADQLAAWPFERARLQHAYGTWLRRQRRVVESRPMLRAAAETFDALGARPWADRSRAELRASGERVRRHPDARDRLTPQELQIAQLGADGLSNREIGERLFLSPRTISTHLYRIFPKLGITGRAELSRVLHPANYVS
jgi:DNA-binding CsgD family transcriptional regulator